MYEHKFVKSIYRKFITRMHVPFPLHFEILILESDIDIANNDAFSRYLKSKNTEYINFLIES